MHSLTLFPLAALASLASAQTYVASFTQYGSNDTFGSGNCNTKSTACGFFDSPGYNAAVSQNVFGAGPGGGAGPACGGCWALTPQSDSTGKALHGANPIVVKVNNLCPAQGNPLCAMSGVPGGMQTSVAAGANPTPGPQHSGSQHSGSQHSHNNNNNKHEMRGSAVKERAAGQGGQGQGGQSGGSTNSLGANVHFDLCIDGGAAEALFGSSGTGLAKGTATRVDCSQFKGGPDQH